MRIKFFSAFISTIALIICFFVVNGCFEKSPSRIVNNYLVSITNVHSSYPSELIYDRNSAEMYQLIKILDRNNIKGFKILREIISGDVASVSFVLYYNNMDGIKYSAALINYNGWKISNIIKD